MKRKFLITFLLLVTSVTFLATGCHEKAKEEEAPEITITTPPTEVPPEVEEEKDVTPPSVSNYSPKGGDVGINTAISVTFSEEMDASTITKDTLTVEVGTGFIKGTVSYSGTTAVFNPSSEWAPGAAYKVTVKKGVTDLSGNGMTDDFSWTFTTGMAKDTEPPMINRTRPSPGSEGVGLDADVGVQFTEEMDPDTINADTFKVIDKDGNAVVGTISYSNKTADLDPEGMLTAEMIYTASVSTDMTDLAGNNLMPFPSWQFKTGKSKDTDTDPPYVTNTLPHDKATGVFTNADILVRFSEPMDPLTITTANLILVKVLDEGEEETIVGTVSYKDTYATYSPAEPLTPGTYHRFVILKDVTDLAGNEMDTNYNFDFTTGGELDTTPPEVVSINPEKYATNVSPSTVIIVRFSEEMDPETITAATLKLYDTTKPKTEEVVACTVDYEGYTATVVPQAPLSNNTVYRFQILKNSVADLAGNPLTPTYLSSFTTGAMPDLIRPEVLTIDPKFFEQGVSTDAKIIVRFSEPMDLNSLNATGAFTFITNGSQFRGTAVLDAEGKIATYTPVQDLLPNRLYRWIISGDVKDLAGNTMGEEFKSSFKTGGQ